MKLPKPALDLPWSNNDGKRGKKRSIWVASSHKEIKDRLTGGPSRHGPGREYVANVTASGYVTKDQAQQNSDFIVWACNNITELLEFVRRVADGEHYDEFPEEAAELLENVIGEWHDLG